jgi:hypothetical protein
MLQFQGRGYVLCMYVCMYVLYSPCHISTHPRALQPAESLVERFTPRVGAQIESWSRLMGPS